MAVIKKKKIVLVQVENRNPYTLMMGNVNWYSYFGKQDGDSQKI